MAVVNIIDGKEIDFSKDIQIWCNDNADFFNEINNYSCFRLILIEEGTGILRIQDKRIAFNAPAIFCLSELENIILEKSSNISVKFIYFHPIAMNYRLNYKILRDEIMNLKYTDKIDSTYLRPFYNRTEDYNGYMDIGISISKKMNQLFYLLNSEITQKNDIYYWPCNARSFFMELLLLIERIYFKHQSTNYIQLGENPDTIIDNVLLYLHLNYNKKITITQLTKQFSINRTTLNEQFHKVMNTSIISYLLNFRIKVASMILRDTTIPVSEVAQRVGFDDVANFNRFFKKHINLTPTEYRQQNNWLIN